MNIVFKKNAKAYNGTEGFWYALFDVGYIKPDNLIADKDQLLQIKDAMRILADFKAQMEQQELYLPS